MKEVPFEIYRNFGAIQNVMGALVSTKYSNFKESYHVKRLSDEVEREFKHFKELHTDLLDSEAEWEDEDKKVMTNKDHIDVKLLELFATTFESKWAPVPVAIIEQVNPTPEQFTIIEHLMDPKDLEI